MPASARCARWGAWERDGAAGRSTLIRQETATGLNAARVRQILADNAAADTPAWLSRLREHDWPETVTSATDPPSASLVAALTEEVTALRQCLGWLEQAERGATAVVNLRRDTDAETEYVVFERWRILPRVGAHRGGSR